MSFYKGYKDLNVYKLAYSMAKEIFELTKNFPKEEKYSLIDQIRRSSRSVSANIAESWAKRRYRAYFISKLTDSLAESYETDVWLNTSLDCNYITKEKHDFLADKYQEINKMLNSMITKPDKFILKPKNQDDKTST